MNGAARMLAVRSRCDERKFSASVQPSGLVSFGDGGEQPASRSGCTFTALYRKPIRDSLNQLAGRRRAGQAFAQELQTPTLSGTPPRHGGFFVPGSRAFGTLPVAPSHAGRARRYDTREGKSARRSVDGF